MLAVHFEPHPAGAPHDHAALLHRLVDQCAAAVATPPTGYGAAGGFARGDAGTLTVCVREDGSAPPDEAAAAAQLVAALRTLVVGGPPITGISGRAIIGKLSEGTTQWVALWPEWFAGPWAGPDGDWPRELD